MIRTLIHSLAERQRTRHGVDVLSSLSDYQLHDIGLTRQDVHYFMVMGAGGRRRP